MFPPPGPGFSIAAYGEAADKVVAAARSLGAQAHVIGAIRTSALKNVAVLHVSASALYGERTRESFWKLVRAAHEQGAAISLDIESADSLRAFGIDALHDAIRQIHPGVVFCNETEGNLLEVRDNHPFRAAIVLQHNGPKPTEVFMASGDQWDVPVPSVDERAIASTGGAEKSFAGAAFAGGFIVGWMHGRSLRSAIELGHEVACQTLQGRDAPQLAGQAESA